MKKAIVAWLGQGKDSNYYVKLTVVEDGWVIPYFVQVSEEKFNTLTKGQEIDVPKAVLK